MNWKEKYSLVLKEVELIETKLIPLRNHIKGIAEYLYSKDYPFNTEVANWFWMASSINSVDFDGVIYDSAFIMCGFAHDYETKKQKLHGKLINELTLFLYVYSGFESLLNNLKLPSCQHKQGKVNKAKNYIKTRYTNYFSTFPRYMNIVGQLRALIKESSMKEYEKYFSIDDCTDYNGIGLKVVYKLRNKLAHGSFSFPEPCDWSFELPLESEIIRLSTRVLLISIQMIMLAKHQGNFKNLFLSELNIAGFNRINENEQINEFHFLRTLHLLPSKQNETQFKLSFVKER